MLGLGEYETQIVVLSFFGICHVASQFLADVCTLHSRTACLVLFVHLSYVVVADVLYIFLCDYCVHNSSASNRSNLMKFRLRPVYTLQSKILWSRNTKKRVFD